MTKTIFFLLCFFLFLFYFSVKAMAASSYVLPYPPAMPGSTLYKLHVLYEKMAKYWYFGDFATAAYNQKESDLYLVEAKTLFEYDQFLLGYQALLQSDSYFENISPSLERAKLHGKNISEKKSRFIEEAKKHIEVLQKLLRDLPKTIEWKPEKQTSQAIDLENAIKQSIAIRENVL